MQSQQAISPSNAQIAFAQTITKTEEEEISQGKAILDSIRPNLPKDIIEVLDTKDGYLALGQKVIDPAELQKWITPIDVDQEPENLAKQGIIVEANSLNTYWSDKKKKEKCEAIIHENQIKISQSLHDSVLEKLLKEISDAKFYLAHGSFIKWDQELRCISPKKLAEIIKPNGRAALKAKFFSLNSFVTFNLEQIKFALDDAFLKALTEGYIASDLAYKISPSYGEFSNFAKIFDSEKGKINLVKSSEWKIIIKENLISTAEIIMLFTNPYVDYTNTLKAIQSSYGIDALRFEKDIPPRDRIFNVTNINLSKLAPQNIQYVLSKIKQFPKNLPESTKKALLTYKGLMAIDDGFISLSDPALVQMNGVDIESMFPNFYPGKDTELAGSYDLFEPILDSDSGRLPIGNKHALFSPKPADPVAEIPKIEAKNSPRPGISFDDGIIA